MNFSQGQTDVGRKPARLALSGDGLSHIDDATDPASHSPQRAVKSAALHSWKEIAAYVCRGVRTVQRWESLGLPVHRPHGKSRSAVLAFPEELDCWLHRTPIQTKANSNSGASNDSHILLELARSLHGLHKALLANKRPQTSKVQELVKGLEQTVTELRSLINATDTAETRQAVPPSRAMRGKQANAA